MAEYDRIVAAYEKLKNLSAERLSELKKLSSNLFEHIPAKDLASILFPPTLCLDLLAGVLSGTSFQDDEFDTDLPDREAVKATLELARWLSMHYFSTNITGTENVPFKGPLLLAANHSAGMMPIDALHLTQSGKKRKKAGNFAGD